MLLKQLLLLLYAAAFLCAPDEFVFYTGKLQDNSTTWRIANRAEDAPVIWKTLVYHPNFDVFYASRDVQNPHFYRITDLGKPTETAQTVIQYYGRVKQMLWTNIAVSPFLVLDTTCLSWLNPAIPRIFRWAGDCSNISHDTGNHTNYHPTRFTSRPIEGAAMSANHVYVYALENLATIHVLSVDSTDAHRHILNKRSGSYIKAIAYGEGYLYFSSEEDRQMITRVNATLLNTPPAPNTEIATQRLFLPSSQVSHLGYPVGVFALAVLPQINEMHYFTNSYMFIEGRYAYKPADRDGNLRVSTFRLLDVLGQKVYEVCFDPNGWEYVYTRLNPDSNCTKRVPLVLKSHLLDYKPGYVNLYSYLGLNGPAGNTGRRWVPHNWQFAYGSEKDGYTRKYRSTTTTPSPSPYVTHSSQIPTVTTTDSAADTRSAWSGVIYGALVVTMLLATQDGVFK